MLQVSRTIVVNPVRVNKVKVDKLVKIGKQTIKIVALLGEITLIAVGVIDARKKYDWL